ncbi:MAG: DNA alkylation repair protein [Anaerolineales bacterium]
MPAIDPNRLARQVEDLIALPDEPDQIARFVRDLVEEYSDQTRSSVPTVPTPVIRSIRGALRQHAQQKALSEALWKESLPDTWLLAAGLLERIEDPEVAATAKRWAGQNVPIEIVRELGERGLTSWRQADPTGFIDQVGNWLDEKRGRSRVLALYALRKRVSDPDFEDLPSILGLLEGRLGGARGEMREALVALIAALENVAPEETMNFLDEEKSSPLVKRLRARFNSQSVRMV